MQQTVLLFHKFRFLFAAILTVAFLMLISAVVTAVGSNSVLAHPSTSTVGIDTSNNANVVADGANAMMADIQRAILSSGSDLYRACHSITTATAQSGKSLEHGSAVVASGIGHGTFFLARGFASSVWHGVDFVRGFGGNLWHGTDFATRWVGSSISFNLDLPARVVGSIARGHAVSSLIRPADNSKPVPVISETSAAVLAKFSAQQQQQIAQWQTAQLAANRSLDGTVIAGDPNRGGYPAKWADAPQDSSLDSWGMYNRECVSYTAWKVYQAYGYMPFWGGVGNANEWPGDAERAGIPTGSTPQVGSVAISTSGYYGHAMWVEKVSGDNIYVSQYNYDLHGDYSEMWVNGSHFTYIYFK